MKLISSRPSSNSGTPPPATPTPLLCRYTEHAINMRGAQICRLQHGFGQHKVCLVTNSWCVLTVWGAFGASVWFSDNGTIPEGGGVQRSNRETPRMIYDLPPLVVHHGIIRLFDYCCCSVNTAVFVFSRVGLVPGVCSSGTSSPLRLCRGHICFFWFSFSPLRTVPWFVNRGSFLSYASFR